MNVTETFIMYIWLVQAIVILQVYISQHYGNIAQGFTVELSHSHSLVCFLSKMLSKFYFIFGPILYGFISPETYGSDLSGHGEQQKSVKYWAFYMFYLGTAKPCNKWTNESHKWKVERHSVNHIKQLYANTTIDTKRYCNPLIHLLY